ncbi:MAG: 50S ribosomal protein L11 methyltransferase [Polyangiaceae bacterium]
MTRIDVAPHWVITSDEEPHSAASSQIVILPGPGFGSGAHETTQLCLLGIRALAPRGRPWTMLDFGSGSGILAIAAARLGATAVAVENDPRAMAHAQSNATANGAAPRVEFLSTLAAARGAYDLVVANILRDVLVQFAADLVARVAREGTLVLSGLVSTDVPTTNSHYKRHLGDRRPEVYARGEWRALVWRLHSAPGPDRR